MTEPLIPPPPAADEPRQDLRESAHRIWLAGLGALAVAEEEGSKLFRQLAEKGEGFEGRAKSRLDEMTQDMREQAKQVGSQVERSWEAVESRLDAALERTLQRIGVPTRKEFDALKDRLDALTRAIEKLTDEKRSG